MLIRSKNKNEKIVMGLLSYTLDHSSTEEQKKLLEEYRNDPDKEIYLYKDDQSDNFVGIVTIERNHLDDASEDEIETILVPRIAVIPSFRNEGVGFSIYQNLRQLYPNATLIGSIKTSDLLARWSKRYHEAIDGVEEA
ncbi:GNAT family N-acetyltransferase [Fundicoccus sp. Sow4_H7]|uniref:GNAT family N-acetyltransferase n=1 Tax=Fundicoccus sp. Sow4_H7 TaxID=3438784 RepID=UPI003F8FCDDF